MGEISSSLVYLRDPRLAAHATSATPVWLWSVDGTRVLWANPIAAAVFGAPTLTDYTIDPKGTAALQIARLAGTLRYGAAPRLERLRGFGGRFGGALVCACTRVTLTDRTAAILVVATQASGPALTLEQRVARLLAGCEEPVAMFTPDGTLIHATPAATARLRGLQSFSALGVSQLAATALASGRSHGFSNAGEITIERIGADAATVLMLMPTAVASQAAAAPPTVAAEPPVATAPAEPAAAPPATPEAAPQPPPAPAAERHKPLRFVWQMDADGRFIIDSTDFTALIGRDTTAALAQSWSDTAAQLGLDPRQQIARAIASRETWSGLTVGFPVDGGRLQVELSGLPVFDRDRSFRGYRGFGVCRDLARISELEQTRRAEPAVREEPPALVIPPSENVVPFRSGPPPEKPPSLTPVERKAFSELASRLTARLRNGEDADAEAPSEPPEAASLPPERPPVDVRTGATDQRPILDRLPVGVLVYRLDSLIYANRAFLDWTGYGDLHALAEAGGLDALFVEPKAGAPRENNGAKLLTIATSRGDQMPIEARLFTSPWEGESALVLMFAHAGGAGRSAEAPTLEARSEARELRSVLDTVTDGVMVLDRDGRIVSVNRSAESLFGYQSRELAGLPLGGLFAPESERTVADYLGELGQRSGPSPREEGREVIGRARHGGLLPLFMTADRVSDGTDKLVAVFRDITAWKKVEADLVNARRQAERGSSAKSEFLAKISHEIRTPLNAIIGFSEVMMEERFGPVGNERYKQYLKDIHSSGGHLVSLLNDLLDLSKIEAGKLELNLTNVDLNELTQQCVALMQPQANRERVIIRTSLSPALPAIVADARSVRQIVLNLLSNSIKFTRAGGQIIVSTAANDLGEVILRVRDTGVGMSENEIAIALEPFRQLATSARWGSGGTGLGLPLTKALAEANRATFSIKSAVNAGTLVEVAFPGRQIAAE